MSDDATLIEARRHVHALRGFLIHLLVFCVVMSGLVALNIVLQAPWWVQWPLLGWGIGLVAHAVLAFTPFRLLDRDWEERKIQHYLERHQSRALLIADCLPRR